MSEEKLALVVANCAEKMVCAADVERRDEDEVSIAVPCEEWDALISAVNNYRRVAMSRYIDATPKWGEVMPLLIEGVRSNHPPSEAELMRLARLTDRLIGHIDAQRDKPDGIDTVEAFVNSVADSPESNSE